jgi:hypothetical protein
MSNSEAAGDPMPTNAPENNPPPEHSPSPQAAVRPRRIARIARINQLTVDLIAGNGPYVRRPREVYTQLLLDP